MSVRVTLTVELDAETLDALDWNYDSPPGMQIERASIGSVLKGMLECDLGELLVRYREAVRKAAGTR